MSVSRLPENFRYEITQLLDHAVYSLRQAEDLARIRRPNLPIADRVRSIYEQVSEDILNGKLGTPPLVQRLRNSERRALRLADELAKEGVSEARIQELWGDA